MNLPLVDSCCFCVPLRTGTLVLGYLHLVGDLLGILLSVLMMCWGIEASSGSIYFTDEYLNMNDDQKKAFSISNESVVAAGSITTGFATIFLILFIVQFVFVCFLLIGGHKGKPKYIKAYLVYSVIMLIIALILTVITLFTVPSLAIISHLIAYALEIYFLLVIRSYMIKLQEDPEGDRAGKIYKSFYDAEPEA